MVEKGIAVRPASGVPASDGFVDIGALNERRTVLGLLVEERRAADPMLAASVSRCRSGLLLPQHSNDLLFCKPARLHVHLLQALGLSPFLDDVWGLS